MSTLSNTTVLIPADFVHIDYVERAEFTAVVFEGLFHGKLPGSYMSRDKRSTPSRGLFTTVFAVAVYCIIAKRGKVNWLLLSSIVFMFVVSTGHFLANVIPAYHAFIDREGGSATLYYVSLVRPYEVTQSVLEDVQILVGDSFLIYRCYVICGYAWQIIIVPVLSLVATFICAAGKSRVLETVNPYGGYYNSGSKSWITASASSTFATNALCTGLIDFKMFLAQRRLRGIQGSFSSAGETTHSALAIIIESAAVYLVALTGFLVCYLLSSVATNVLSDILVSVIGTTFSVITIRIALGFSSISGLSKESTENSREIITIGGSHRLVQQEMEMNRRVRVHVDSIVEVLLERGDANRLA